uniref:Uncharacterized protein n=1 Tax=Knipowitschia caucasica TaxID=637954 RepID=A0AAV2M485_KNICA
MVGGGDRGGMGVGVWWFVWWIFWVEGGWIGVGYEVLGWIVGGGLYGVGGVRGGLGLEFVIVVWVCCGCGGYGCWRGVVGLGVGWWWVVWGGGECVVWWLVGVVILLLWWLG